MDKYNKIGLYNKWGLFNDKPVMVRTLTTLAMLVEKKFHNKFIFAPFSYEKILELDVSIYLQGYRLQQLSVF